ncbi:Uncharacterized protein GBIM_08728 [Gryllus bimaculatus]|nr:Uncharacterized protein GBIM_08728 [Gryllus bimaculatus]
MSTWYGAHTGQEWPRDIGRNLARDPLEMAGQPGILPVAELPVGAGGGRPQAVRAAAPHVAAGAHRARDGVAAGEAPAAAEVGGQRPALGNRLGAHGDRGHAALQHGEERREERQKVFEGDDNEKFEKNWLYWTGARMLYRYLPKSVGLRRITLHKSLSSGDKMYLLMCECSNFMDNLSAAAILLPALRARLCGYTGLYRTTASF